MKDAQHHDGNESRSISLCEAAARHVFGMILPEELPEVAVEAMVAGLDSQSLRLLAGASRGTPPHELHDLLETAATELGLLPMEPLHAARLLTWCRAGRVAEGRAPPLEALVEVVERLVMYRLYDHSDPSTVIEQPELSGLYDLYLEYDCMADGDGWPDGGKLAEIERRVEREFGRIAARPAPTDQP